MIDRFRILTYTQRDFKAKYRMVEFALAFAYYMQPADKALEHNDKDTCKDYLRHFKFMMQTGWLNSQIEGCPPY